jgi:hypothetical protein
MFRTIGFLLVLMGAGSVWAELPGVLRWDVEQKIEPTYREVYKALEENRYFIILEPDIGRNLRSFKGRWGEDYNRNKLKSIRTMVFCNPWYANRVSNMDPALLSLCPLHVTLFEKDRTTSIVFIRPTHVGEGSKALPVLEEIEAEVSKAIEAGIKAATFATRAK